MKNVFALKLNATLMLWDRNRWGGSRRKKHPGEVITDNKKTRRERKRRHTVPCKILFANGQFWIEEWTWRFTAASAYVWVLHTFIHTYRSKGDTKYYLFKSEIRPSFSKLWGPISLNYLLNEWYLSFARIHPIMVRLCSNLWL